MALLTKCLLDLNVSDPETFAFLTQLDVIEPATYNAAMGSKYPSRWTQAMMDEWQSLIDNETWDLVDSSTVPNDHSVLKGKWVFRVKRGRDGKITRFKARWVVKGYLQQYGLDYDQTFAAVVKPMAFRILFALAAYHDLDIDQMDVVHMSTDPLTFRNIC